MPLATGFVVLFSNWISKRSATYFRQFHSDINAALGNSSSAAPPERPPDATFSSPKWKTWLDSQKGGGYYIPVRRRVSVIRVESKSPNDRAMSICGLHVYRDKMRGTPPVSPKPFDADDAYCTTGIVGFGDSYAVCCAAECGRCGGSGCSNFGEGVGADKCCFKKIRDSGRKCTWQGDYETNQCTRVLGKLLFNFMLLLQPQAMLSRERSSAPQEPICFQHLAPISLSVLALALFIAAPNSGCGLRQLHQDLLMS